MQGTGETLTELTERKPQSERAALEARAAILFRFAKAFVKEAGRLSKERFTMEGQQLWKSKRADAREYLARWSETRKQISEIAP